jgi:hypothetical protein
MTFQAQRFAAAVVLMLAAVGCGGVAVPPPSVSSPASPLPGDPRDTAVVESVRAYLRTFHLNEKDLAAGLTIPWEVNLPDVYGVGMARATGRLGPQGHQIYELTEFDYVLTAANHGSHRFLEIAPE